MIEKTNSELLVYTRDDIKLKQIYVDLSKEYHLYLLYNYETNEIINVGVIQNFEGDLKETGLEKLNGELIAKILHNRETKYYELKEFKPDLYDDGYFTPQGK